MNSPIRRLGVKNKIIKELTAQFPKDKRYLVELFAGSGNVSIYCSQFIPNYKYFYLNDFDQNIYKTWSVINNKKQCNLLIEKLLLFPICQTTWRKLKTWQPKSTVNQVFKFLVFSNFGFLGKPDTLLIGNNNNKSILIKNIKTWLKYRLKDKFKYLNVSYEKGLSQIGFRTDIEYNNTFIYADPPYYQKRNNYAKDCKSIDLKELLLYCISTGLQFAVSELLSEYTENLAKELNLNIIHIKIGRNLNNVATEILITNYSINIPKQTLLYQ